MGPIREETSRWMVAAQESLFKLERAFRENDFGGAQKCVEDLERETKAVRRNVGLMIAERDFTK